MSNLTLGQCERCYVQGTIIDRVPGRRLCYECAQVVEGLNAQTRVAALERQLAVARGNLDVRSEELLRAHVGLERLECQLGEAQNARDKALQNLSDWQVSNAILLEQYRVEAAEQRHLCVKAEAEVAALTKAFVEADRVTKELLMLSATRGRELARVQAEVAALKAQLAEAHANLKDCRQHGCKGRALLRVLEERDKLKAEAAGLKAALDGKEKP